MKAALLLGKDLRVLGRSPALVAALLVYPLVIAVLVGLVVRFADERPRVAFVDLDGLPDTLVVGGQRFEVTEVLNAVDDEVELVPLGEEEAERRLETGEVTALVVVPRGFAARLRAMGRSPTLVLKTAQGGLAGRVEQQMQALVYSLNRRLQEAYIASNLRYIGILLKGGSGNFLGNEFDVVGLEKAARLLAEIERTTDNPSIAAKARDLSVFVREARLALAQTDLALKATANPIELETESEVGRTWLLSAQVQAYSLALTLAFICVLLAAAAIASERDENVIGRLARGLVRLAELLLEKIALVTLIGLALGLVIALIFGATVELGGVVGGEPWERLPLLALGLALAAAAFGAFGVLLGVLAREARVASLVAFLVALPLVLVGLVPEGSIAAASWISNAFPFVHSVRLFGSALYDLDPWGALAREAGWLLGLGALFALAARMGVRRLLA